jgi:D-3-phosphoglycerate dehydrogenase
MHLAEARGIQVQSVRLPVRGDYAEYVELRVRSSKEATQVAGALLAQRHPRVVRIGDYHVDIFPRHTLLVLRNRDVPGVIGRVGTALGDAGINIGEYHQSRREAGGEALAAISLDDRLAADVMESLRQLPEILEVRQVQLD